MFNAKQKEQFLNSIANDNSYKSYMILFRKCERFEKSFGKDVADMTLDEILNMLDVISCKNASSVATSRSLLGTYIDWCIRNGKSIFNENNVSKIEADAILPTRNFRNSYVGSKEELNEILDTVLPEENYHETIMAIYKSIFFLSYEGLSENEIICLKKQNVDFEEKIIYSPVYDNVFYSADDELLSYLKICIESDEIIFPSRDFTYKLCENDYVFRPRVSKRSAIDYDRKVSNSYVWKKISTVNEEYLNETGTYKKLTSKTLADSKKFYDYHNTKDKDAFLDGLKVEYEMKTNKSKKQIYVSIAGFKKNYKIWETVFC